jgi:uncharacterized protein YkwD
MKYHFFGTFCLLISVMGIATTARAEISTNIPSDRLSPTSEVSADPSAPPTIVMNSSELAIYNGVNQYRQSQNLAPLVVDPAISAQAKAHSEKMARNSSLSHDGFNERVNSVSQTIVYRSVAENVGYNMGYAQPEAMAVKGWIDSPGHQHNLVGRYDLTGIGVAKSAKGEYFFTQIFIRKAFYVKDAD